MVLAGQSLFGRPGISGTEVRAATVLVAKDGSGDTDDIQEGINMLPPNGGNVFIKEGIYTLGGSGTITINVNNTSLFGSGRELLPTKI